VKFDFTSLWRLFVGVGISGIGSLCWQAGNVAIDIRDTTRSHTEALQRIEGNEKEMKATLSDHERRLLLQEFRRDLIDKGTPR